MQKRINKFFFTDLPPLLVRILRPLLTPLRYLAYLALGFIAFGLYIYFGMWAYLIFYWNVLPSESLEIPLALQFYDHQPPFAVASVDSSFFLWGQEYELVVVLDVPDSPANVNIGMFMVDLELEASLEEPPFVVTYLNQALILRYRSELLRMLTTWVKAIPLIFGWAEETQTLKASWIRQLNYPFDRIRLSLSSRNLQVYSATLQANVRLYGLRYFMRHWFLTSMVIGTFMNVFWEILGTILVWIAAYKFWWSVPQKPAFLAPPVAAAPSVASPSTNANTKLNDNSNSHENNNNNTNNNTNNNNNNTNNNNTNNNNTNNNNNNTNNNNDSNNTFFDQKMKKDDIKQELDEEPSILLEGERVVNKDESSQTHHSQFQDKEASLIRRKSFQPSDRPPTFNVIPQNETSQDESPTKQTKRQENFDNDD